MAMASRAAVRWPLHLHRASLRHASSSVATTTAMTPGPCSRPCLPQRRPSSSHGNGRHALSAPAVQERRRPSSPPRPPRQPPKAAEFHTSHRAPFQTQDSDHSLLANAGDEPPGSVAFGECEIAALSDLFLQFAETKDSVDGGRPYLDVERVRLLLESVGEKPDEATLRSLMEDIGSHEDGRLRLDCFLRASDRMLGTSPARIVLVVGGPGSGKGALCARLAAECGAVHLSCGEMLREEVEAGTPLGREAAAIMERGELVSSALVTALMRRRMRRHPGRRVLLDGFPRSLENARDFVGLCGPPELALHLSCDDAVLLERILARGGRSAREAERAKREGGGEANSRSDDNVHTAIQRLKNYHKHHPTTMSWLKEIRVPIVELDCSGSKDDVWGQLAAIGRLMRPAVQLPQRADAQAAVPANGSAGTSPSAANEDVQWIA